MHASNLPRQCLNALYLRKFNRLAGDLHNVIAWIPPKNVIARSPQATKQSQGIAKQSGQIAAPFGLAMTFLRCHCEEPAGDEAIYTFY
jgi:hypothetical protein